MSRVLVISHDVVGSRMAGPGIRYWEIAGALSRRHETTLACPNQTDLEGRGFQLTSYRREDPESLRELAEKAQIIVVCGDTLERFPWLRESDKPIVVDLYDPFILENLEMDRSLSAGEQSGRQESGLRVMKGLIEAGDFFLCANQRQRDFWLGMLAAWGRLTPEVYQADPSLEFLIAEVPFGLPSDPPHRTKQVLKGVWPGIGPEDKVVLWGGGLWDWLDPVTAVQAMKWVNSRRDDVRLFFMGTRHPNRESVPEMKVAIEARRLSEQLGLLDRQVFFNEWVPYHERADYLLEADLGISLHLDLVETRFSSRTRLLDCFWAGLPVVVTGGDPLAERVNAKGLGLVVGYRDIEGAGSAILRLLERPRLKEELSPGFQDVASSLRWDSVCEPLLRFCDQPRLFSQRRTMGCASGPPAGSGGALSRAISRVRGIGAGTRHGA
ncbi:MAG: glycosyltransferase family 4 protein [Dehalococcoidia bacterium]|nr:glycosyltransferase family 4 protein [Dehalococcoidia bacterium]